MEKRYDELTKEEVYNIIMDKKLDDILEVMLENTISFEDRLKNEGITFEEGKNLCCQFIDKFQNLCSRYALPLNNKAKFCYDLNKLLKQQQNEELLWLYCVVVVDLGLLFNKNKNPLRVRETEICKYLNMRMMIAVFSNNLKEKVRYKAEFKKIISSKQNKQCIWNTSDLFIKSEDIEAIFTAYHEYIGGGLGIKNNNLKENIESLSWQINNSIEWQKIAPLFFYQILINHKRRIVNSANFYADISKIWKYKHYQIYSNNGKNFKSAEKHIVLFLKLCEHFFSKPQVSKKITLYGYAELSNLPEWYYDVYQYKDLLTESLEEAAQYDMLDLRVADDAIPMPVESILERLYFSCYSEEEYTKIKEIYYRKPREEKKFTYLYDEIFWGNKNVIDKIIAYVRKNWDKGELFFEDFDWKDNQAPFIIEEIYEMEKIQMAFPDQDAFLLKGCIQTVLFQIIDQDIKTILSDTLNMIK